MSEENRAILRRVNDEVFSQGNFGLVDELFAPDDVLHDRSIPGGDCVALRTSSNDGLYISHRLPRSPTER